MYLSSNRMSISTRPVQIANKAMLVPKNTDARQKTVTPGLEGREKSPGRRSDNDSKEMLERRSDEASEKFASNAAVSAIERRALPGEQEPESSERVNPMLMKARIIRGRVGGEKE